MKQLFITLLSIVFFFIIFSFLSRFYRDIESYIYISYYYISF